MMRLQIRFFIATFVNVGKKRLMVRRLFFAQLIKKGNKKNIY